MDSVSGIRLEVQKLSFYFHDTPTPRNPEQSLHILTFMKNFLKNPKIITLLVVAALMGGVCLYAMWATGISPAELKRFIEQTIETISDYPVLVYLSVLIVGGLPLPLSPFLILAGVLFNNRYGLPTSLALCYSAMVLNMIWTYFLSAYPMRALFEKMVGLFFKKSSLKYRRNINQRLP